MLQGGTRRGDEGGRRAGVGRESRALEAGAARWAAGVLWVGERMGEGATGRWEREW